MYRFVFDDEWYVSFPKKDSDIVAAVSILWPESDSSAAMKKQHLFAVCRIDRSKHLLFPALSTRILDKSDESNIFLL